LEKETKQPIYRSYFITGHETAGKQIDDEDLRELMKKNGIGRQQELT
jgi:DNA topoisomerase-3